MVPEKRIVLVVVHDKHRGFHLIGKEKGRVFYVEIQFVPQRFSKSALKRSRTLPNKERASGIPEWTNL